MLKPLLSESATDIDHFNRGERRLAAFIACFAPCSIKCMIHRGTSENTKCDRDSTGEAGIQNSGCNLMIDVFVMSRLSLDDSP